MALLDQIEGPGDIKKLSPNEWDSRTVQDEAFDYDDQGEEIRQWVKDQISAKK